jgi:hypothetical protein
MISKMKIEFYEEFPTSKNLEKLKLVKFKTKVFIASRTTDKFNIIKKQIKNINKKTEVYYWPIINSSYYISPFSNTRDLAKLFSELDRTNLPLLIDLEPPIKISMFFKNLIHFSRNKKMIKRFLKKNKDRITIAKSSFLLFFFSQKMMDCLGFDYKLDIEKSLMFYTSTIPRIIKRKFYKKLAKIKNKQSLSLGLGIIAKGIHEKEKILEPGALERDLELAKRLGFKKVIIFRVGGLNKEYIKIIEKFV